MFYHAASLEELNEEEFAEHAIIGKEFPVVYVDFPEGVGPENYKSQTLNAFEQYVTGRDDVWITGGVTDNLPAANKFTTRKTFPPGLVLIMDETNIPDRLERVEYDVDWFDAHPGVLPRVTTLRDGELREDGKIVGLLGVRESKITLDEYRRHEVENEATATRYSSEREMVAFAPEIYLDDSIVAVAAYLGTSGVSPYTLARVLFESPSYRSRMGDVYRVQERERVAGAEEYRKQAELLHDEVEPLIEYDEAPFYIVAVEDHNDISAEDGRITPDNFRFVYNGRDFDTSYERNSRLLGGA